ncbi:MAG: type secretion-associated serine protease mycosin [Marmoricola sp.]|nr:type secretion-associated serine protease mycosin [Marmoricola sp.]
MIISTRAALVLGGLAAVLVGPGLPTAGATPGSSADAVTDCQRGQTSYVKQTQASNALPMISTPQTWKIATGKGVKVAVVDSGVDVRNQHLTTAVAPGRSLLGDDGRVDTFGHGTSVAGVIAARRIPQSVLVGQAPDATLLPFRVYDSAVDTTSGESTAQRPLDPAGVAQGIRWAADAGAKVINVSLSSGPSATGLDAERAAVRYAQRKGALIVAATGDSQNGQPVTMKRYPASFPGVLGVAAANSTGNVDDYSIHGSDVDVVAPGQKVIVPFYDNGDCLGGENPQTSYATGFVSGLAAQLVQRFPKDSPDMIAWRIASTAKRARPSQRDDASGWGLIQPYAALTLLADPSRPGPPMPGAARVAATTEESGLTVTGRRTDRLDPVRREVTWWSLGGVGLAALALVLTPLVRRRRG